MPAPIEILADPAFQAPVRQVAELALLDTERLAIPVFPAQLLMLTAAWFRRPADPRRGIRKSEATPRAEWCKCKTQACGWPWFSSQFARRRARFAASCPG